ncbi:monovalent cation/H(+) antiporter subunit G [Metabacillus litoralis]|uniref:monovalent cation/H(+) antiporter subunit G n=1 Tax=Metabacillus TaxID=2675233 RepID=UPI001B935220|nr:monovalent cation/H(+) antiporter subunit G [Metabacillus litoralis]MCM3161132.1 monovalent cation/H(+) antiporter subunit G [Metabacillus litoralis]MCM3413708.1 monovalent cation/H(+) antiporter subunit G [Metabacillus litoralis]UHA62546.1 monovalent cation/H(+) antiporter subunit G [Metabacillus litoralis]
MIEISKFIVGFLILQGSLLSLIAAIGVVRLPDPYTRNHAASKSATLGIISILLGLFMYYLLIDHHANSRVLLGIIFVFITAPVAGHLISRAAYNIGVPLWEKSVQDDLAKVRKHEKSR